MRWLSDRPVWLKLTLVVGAMLVPVVVLMYLLISGNNALIQFAEKEKEGSAYGVPLSRLAQELTRWRGAAARHLQGGNAESRTALRSQTEAVNQQMSAVAEADQRHGNSLKATEAFAQLKDRWGKLAAAVEGGKLTAAEAQNQYSQVMGDVVGLFALVGETSNLLFDPVLESYYLMDVMFYRVPKEADLLSQIREVAAGAARTGQASAEDKQQILLLVGQHQAYQEAITGDVQSTLKANPGMAAKLRGPTDEYTAAADAFVALVMKEVIAPNEVRVTADALTTAGDRAVNATFALYSGSVADLDGLLQGRIDKETGRNQIASISIAAGLLITLALVGFIIHRIARQVAAIMSVFQTIGAGDFHARVQVYSKDELGDLADSVNVMLDNTIGLVESR